MKKLSRLAWVTSFFAAALLTGVRFGWALSYSDPPNTTVAGPREGEPSQGSPIIPLTHLVGAASCSAAACHNGPWQSAPKRSEYSVWIDFDPHSRAESTLHTERSRSILKNLRGLASPQEARPEQDLLCLACHVQPNPSLAAQSFPERFTAADGVSCEVCHGGAKNWLASHFSHRWKTLSSAEKEEIGQLDTKNLLTRARACVSCHVGQEGGQVGAMEVNHDLIAAGHPRLRFELGAYLANYTARHWSLRDEKARYPDFEARVWALGQLVSAQAALKLLAFRATPGSAQLGTPERPWPELAEFNCASCHHQLKPLTRADIAQNGNALPNRGLPLWGTWYFSGLSDLLRGLDDPRARELSARLESLERLMRNPAADRAAIKAMAGALANQLQTLITRVDLLTYDPARCQALQNAILETGERSSDWESATQKFLGLKSLGQSLRDAQSATYQGDGQDRSAFERGLTDLGKALDRAFPSGRESLGGSPDLYDKLAIRDLFDRLKNSPR